MNRVRTHPRIPIAAGLPITVCLLYLQALQPAGAAPPVAASLAGEAGSASLYAEEARYTILRDGKRVGTHRLRFADSGARARVEIESNIEIKLLGLTVFRFRYFAEELWQDGALTAVTASTRENDDETTVSLSSTGSESTLARADGSRVVVPRLHFSTNHWHRGVLEAARVFNTLTGEANTVEVEALGVERFETGAGDVAAERFRYRGDVEADVWYDDAGRWIGLRFEREGSEILYRADF